MSLPLFKSGTPHRDAKVRAIVFPAPGELRPNWKIAFHARLCVIAGQTPSDEWIITMEKTVALCALLRDPLPMQ
jgi:hypothetical protein